MTRTPPYCVHHERAKEACSDSFEIGMTFHARKKANLHNSRVLIVFLQLSRKNIGQHLIQGF